MINQITIYLIYIYLIGFKNGLMKLVDKYK